MKHRRRGYPGGLVWLHVGAGILMGMAYCIIQLQIYTCTSFLMSSVNGVGSYYKGSMACLHMVGHSFT